MVHGTVALPATGLDKTCEPPGVAMMASLPVRLGLQLGIATYGSGSRAPGVNDDQTSQTVEMFILHMALGWLPSLPYHQKEGHPSPEKVRP